MESVNDNLSYPLSYKDDFIRYSKGWKRIGIDTCVCKVESVLGIKKLYKSTKKITDEIRESSKNLSTDFNFLGVVLTNSSIMCLDIEGNIGSVESFINILTENGLDLKDFFYERTMNGGLHLYFRIIQEEKTKNQYKKNYRGVYFDVLFNGISFTYPSKYLDKSYSKLNKDILFIKSIDEIPYYPEEIKFLIEKSDI